MSGARKLPARWRNGDRLNPYRSRECVEYHRELWRGSVPLATASPDGTWVVHVGDGPTGTEAPCGSLPLIRLAECAAKESAVREEGKTA